MYVPETSMTGIGERVIVLTDNEFGYAFGQYTGHSRGETYQIRVENIMSGDKHDEWIHKEDIYQNTEDNLERVREIV
jgi:hypothetical protein